VPEVVNLVFFKLVRSKTKFTQMVGRGTRLCPDLFGPGKDKEFFYIFDYCQNLEFFSQNPETVEGSAQEPLGKRLFLARLELHQRLAQAEGGHMKDSPEESLPKLRRDFGATLRQEVAAMNVDNFIVRAKRRSVEKYRQESPWTDLKPPDYTELARDVAGLPSELEPEEEEAKRFDLLVLSLQLAMLKAEPSFERLRDEVKNIASLLEEKASIPMVREQLPLIQDLQTSEYWQDITLPMLEAVRKRLRLLVKLIDKKKRKPIYSDFTDQMGAETEVALPGFAGAADLAQFRRKLMSFLKAHEDHIALKKLKHNEPVTALDLTELDRLLFEAGGVGTRAELETTFGPQPKLGLFIRSLVGLDREAAKKAFAGYLNDKTYSSNQIQFINHVIDHLTQNGVMEPRLLYESPYTDLNPAGLDGVFGEQEAQNIVQILDGIRQCAFG
jgi:type I restriction enzyme R subunit